MRRRHPDVPAPEDLAVGVQSGHDGIAGMKGFGRVDDDVVFGIGNRGDDAAGGDFGEVVPAFPEHGGIGGVGQIGERIIALDSLELVAAGFLDDIAVGATLGIQVADIGRERVLIVLQLCGDVADPDLLAADDIHRLGVLENLRVVAAFLELEGKAGFEGKAVGNVDEDVAAVQVPLQLQHGIAQVLEVVLFAVSDLHLQEFIADGFFLGSGDHVALVVAFHRQGKDAADALEGEGVALVAGSEDFLVGGGELAVEETVLEIVGHRRRIGGVQGAGAIVALVGIEAVHLHRGGFPVTGDVPGGEGHDHLVLGIFAVDDDLVAGLPGGLEGGGDFPVLSRLNGGEDEGKRPRLGLRTRGGGVHRVRRLLVAGSRRQDSRT